MDRLDAMRVFVRVAESGSFSAVARETGVGQPAISKQVAALEARLGVQLLRRTSRSMSLTETGQTFYEAACRMVTEMDEAEAAARGGDTAPSGVIKVTVAPVFGRLYVVPRLPEFFARYPGISVEVSVSERSINLVEEGVDVAIRNGDLPDSSLVVRRIAQSTLLTVATPRYLQLHGKPRKPTDLSKHQCVVFTSQGEARLWSYKTARGTESYRPSGRFRTPDAEQVRAGVLADLGLACAPDWLFAPDIRSGAVEVVLRDYQLPAFPISVVHPSGRRLPTRVRVFIEYFAEYFSKAPTLNVTRTANTILKPP